MGSLSTQKILVVDFNKDDMKPGSTTWLKACKDIRQALENHGCFIALYDKISSQLQKSICKAADELFNLPTEVKVKNISDKPYHGYVAPLPIIPLHESFGIDYANTLEGAEDFTKLMWPDGNDSFCEAILTFSKIKAELDRTVNKMLFKSYGVERHIDSHIESTTHLLRFMKYRVPEVGETNLAFPCHTDKSFMTVLYQNHVSGLEVQARDGEWINVEFPPSAFVVMAGDACKAWSNDKVLSPIHKVILDNNVKETRYAVGLFSFLTKGTVQVPEELVNDENPLQYKPFNHIDLVKIFATEQGRRSQNLLKDFCGV